MAQLSWRHHTLIQALLSRGPLEDKEFYSLFLGISGKNPETHKKIFDDVLYKINKELAYVQFELRGCRNQYDGKIYYGVINTIADEQSKLGTKYSVPQIAFYRAILDAIMQDPTAQGCISNIDALNIRLENQVQTGQSSQDGHSHVPSAFRSFTLAQKEKTVNELVQDQWLCSTLNGNIGLGVRSFLDLRGWFRSNDFPSCEVCNEAGVKAEMCKSESCNIRIHGYCLKKKFSGKVARVCPGCGAAWHFSQSDWEEEGHDTSQSQPPSNSLPKGKRLQTCKAETVEAAQERSRVASGCPTRRLRSCKAEVAADATQAELSQELGHHPKAPRSLRSRRI
uniref:Non-structural maintenance of chromosomes element 1 homolog n=1 Tax=Anthurium amnicola TaxID=1678845 RepID=A0A1D1XDQ5_9ARAE